MDYNWQGGLGTALNIKARRSRISTSREKIIRNCYSILFESQKYNIIVYCTTVN